MKDRNIYKFFIKMVLIFLVLNLFMIFAANELMINAIGSKYGENIIFEIFYGLIVLIVLLLFRNSYVFIDKKEKFINGVILACPVIISSILSLLDGIQYINHFSFSIFINIAVYSLFVGITEEFLCRGWLQNEFIERFSNDKNTVLKSILLSSLVFGSMHIVNILGNQGLFETLLQVMNATALGFLFGCIYYKTKNIWSIIFLHAFYDFTLIISEMNVIKDCTFTIPTFTTTMVDLLSIIILMSIWLLTALLIIRKTNYPDKKVSKKENPTTKYVVAGIIIALIMSFIPFSELIPGYVNNTICYTYKELNDLDNYTIHYPSERNYSIKLEKEEKTFVQDEDNQVFEEYNNNSYNFDFIIESNKLYVINKNTEYKKELYFDNVSSILILNNYEIVVLSTTNSDTVYYSNYITYDNINNKDSYLYDLEDSFIEYSVPEIKKLGYITFDDSDTEYPYLYNDKNEFIIKNGELFIVE